ncbi:unnamed protein product [Rotaria sp. Silwood2]|nr:unnamed protein product [Rotaria sp. Silwood2]
MQSKLSHSKSSESRSYKKKYSIQPMHLNLKFFKSQSFCSNLQEHILKQYNVICRVPSVERQNDETELQIRLSGEKMRVNDAHDYIHSLFETVQAKIFNDEIKDRQIIHWSTHIHSDSAVAIIQQVFDNKKAFTIWEKDDLVFGHYIVHYFTHGCEFSLKEKHIYPILQDDISFESQISVMNFDNLQTNYRKELEQFLDDKKHEQQQRKQFLIIYSKHPLQTEMKIRFFGEKTLVKNSARELRNLMSKHQIKVVNIGLDFERVSQHFAKFFCR